MSNEQLAIDLGRFNALATGAPQRKSASWTPPALTAFRPGTVLAFDQTLANTGWALLQHLGEDGIRLLDAGMIRPPVNGLTSHEDSYARAKFIGDCALRVIDAYFLPAGPREVVYERPSMEGRRTESALLAGLEIYRASNATATAVSNRHAKAVIVGRAGTNADPVTKAHVKAAVEHYVSPSRFMGPGDFPWNEHVRDAVMLGLTRMYDQMKAATS
ncbi:hypothetical protein ACFZAM_31515 [Streptomyces sp. NPDC008079]|uniref:hypothetical protein n=1 Tax=Streptomyces sp. NPDC008079 TaxID=3364806 RepID=UPI0036EA5FBB